MRKIKIYTDSACDLDIDYLNELEVSMVPLGVYFDTEEYKDRITMTTKEFYERLKSFKGQPKTSQVNPAQFVEVFQRGLDEGFHIICLSFSSKLSGTYQSAVIARDTIGSEFIDVIDTRAASVGQGLIVREAALMAKSGKSRDEIIERIEFFRSKMEHIFAVGSLEMLKRGGRISTAQAMIGGILNVKPILQFQDGAIVPYDKVRGEKAIIKKMIDTMKERGSNIEGQVIGLNYSGTDSLCLELRKEIEETFGVKEFVISEIGAAIGSHVGSGTVAVFFLRK